MGRKRPRPDAPSANNFGPGDPPRAVLAVDAAGRHVAAALGRRVLVLDTETGALATPPDALAHAATVRALAFDSSGGRLASGGDDKCVRVWRVGSWELLVEWTAPKKVSAVTFTADPAVVLAADKFGDVLAGPATAAAAAAVVAPPPATTARSDTAPPPPPPGLHLMFAHFCTIVTSMAPSTTGPPAVVTTDRDGKVRVTDVPPDVAAAATPGTLTAPTIRAMCIGHTAFASSATWCGSRPDGGRLIASGGGDGAVRLWCVDGDAAGGPPLATHATSPAAAAHAAARADARAKVAAAVAARRAEKAVTAAACPGALARPAAPAGGGGDDDDGEGSEADAEGLFLPTRLPPPPAVIAVASTPPSLPASIIAIVEGEAGVARVLTVDATAGTLTRSDDLPLPGVDAPAALAVDAAGRVWAAGAAAAGLQVAAVVLPGSGAIGVPAAALAALTAAADGGGDEGAAGCQVSPEIRRGMAAPVKEAVAVA